MPHAYDQAQKSLEHTKRILELAHDSALEGLDAARRSGVISPTPAQHHMILHAITLAVNTVKLTQEGSRFELDEEKATRPEGLS